MVSASITPRSTPFARVTHSDQAMPVDPQGLDHRTARLVRDRMPPPPEPGDHRVIGGKIIAINQVRLPLVMQAGPGPWPFVVSSSC